MGLAIPTDEAMVAAVIRTTSFEQYLIANEKRNFRQILCYAQRYHEVIETGDASALVNLSSGALRRHAMEALTAYAKYTGSYEKWRQICKRYSLRWTNGDESLRAMHRFFNQSLDLDSMLQRINEMMRLLPPSMSKIVKIACIIGLRPSEVVECVRLINADLFPIPGNGKGSRIEKHYYNPERQALEHFRFPEIFLRQTKKAYISFVTPEMLEPVSCRIREDMPTRNAITRACQRRHVKMDMHLTRKIFASWVRKEGIQPEIVDLLQGRVSQSILTRHYLVPDHSLKDRVLTALQKLNQQLI